MGGSRSVVLAGAALGILSVGFGLGILFGAGRAPEVRTILVPGPAPESPKSTGPAPQAPSSATPSSTLPDTDREALRALLARQPGRDVPSGAGVITGRVRTEEGAPLAGVEVACNPEWPRDSRAMPKPGATPAPPDPVESALITYQFSEWQVRARKSAVTDAAGEFRFEGLADVKHRIEPKLKGWRFVAKEHGSQWEARPGTVVEFVATPFVDVRVEVTWAGARTPESLQVKFQSGSSTTGCGLNPENPIVSVPPGSYQVQAIGGASQEWMSDPQSVDLKADGEIPTLKFVLKTRPGIQGRILIPDGEENDQVQVRSLRLTGNQKAEPAVFASTFDRGGGSGGRGRQAGTYAFPGLAPGRYAVGVSRSYNLPVIAVEEVEVVDALVDRDIRVPPLQPQEYVTLSVVGPDGALVRDYQVATGYQSKSMNSSGGSTAIQRPDGTRWVLHHAMDQPGDADGLWWIQVTAPKFGSKKAEYRRGTDSAVTIRFDEVGQVAVRLDGYKGHTHEGRLRLSIQAAGEGGRSFSGSSEDRIGDDGTQTFPQVQPGEYFVVLQLSSDRMPTTVARMPVTVKAGRNDVVLRVPALYAVTVTGAKGMVIVRNKEDPPFSMMARVDAEGKAILDGLPEGEYEVRSGPGNQTIRVPGTTEVKF